MDKVADKVSQLVKRNSKEKLTEASAAPESPLPPFKPIPKIQLARADSLPRIEVERPATPAAAAAGGASPGHAGKSVQFPASAASAAKPSDYSLGQIIPPNAKKLRVRSFLWVKPSASSGLDTSIYYQVYQHSKHSIFTKILTKVWNPVKYFFCKRNQLQIFLWGPSVRSKRLNVTALLET